LGREGSRGGGYRALVAAPGCWWPLCALAPSSRAGWRPATSAVGAAATRATPAATCGQVSGPPPVRTYALAHPPQLACRFPEGVCCSAQDITREHRHQRGAAAVAYGVAVYSPQGVLPSRSRTSAPGVSAPLVHRPCQVGSGSCVPRAVPVHVHGGLVTGQQLRC
jgi:hypothetical protein